MFVECVARQLGCTLMSRNDKYPFACAPRILCVPGLNNATRPKCRILGRLVSPVCRDKHANPNIDYEPRTSCQHAEERQAIYDIYAPLPAILITCIGFKVPWDVTELK